MAKPEVLTKYVHWEFIFPLSPRLLNATVLEEEKTPSAEAYGFKFYNKHLHIHM